VGVGLVGLGVGVTLGVGVAVGPATALAAHRTTAQTARRAVGPAIEIPSKLRSVTVEEEKHLFLDIDLAHLSWMVNQRSH
jgi:hypothetical protein